VLYLNCLIVCCDASLSLNLNFTFVYSRWADIGPSYDIVLYKLNVYFICVCNDVLLESSSEYSGRCINQTQFDFFAVRQCQRQVMSYSEILQKVYKTESNEVVVTIVPKKHVGNQCF